MELSLPELKVLLLPPQLLQLLPELGLLLERLRVSQLVSQVELLELSFVAVVAAVKASDLSVLKSRSSLEAEREVNIKIIFWSKNNMFND